VIHEPGDVHAPRRALLVGFTHGDLHLEQPQHSLTQPVVGRAQLLGQPRCLLHGRHAAGGLLGGLTHRGDGRLVLPGGE
jgi:hypothetical protein